MWIQNNTKIQYYYQAVAKYAEKHLIKVFNLQILLCCHTSPIVYYPKGESYLFPLGLQINNKRLVHTCSYSITLINSPFKAYFMDRKFS